MIPLSLAGSAVSAYSSIQQGKQEKDAAEYEVQLSRLNQQTISNEVANESDMVREKYRRLRGAQVATVARSGISMSGSAADVVLDTNVQENRDLASLYYKRAQALTTEQYKASMARARGANAVKASRLTAVGSILSSAGEMIGNYPKLT